MKNVALVTGAASGLGAVISRYLWSQGYAVVLADISLSSAQQMAREIDVKGQRTVGVQLDIRDRDAFSNAIDHCVAHFGGLHVLVNNAALTLATPVMSITVEEFDQVMTTNLRGTFLGCQLAGGYFATQQYGRIINLASLAGQNGGTASGAHYAASKGGILTLTKVFARALSHDGVTVNAIAPGPMDLPSVHAMVPDDKMQALLQMIPVEKLGEPEFVAQAVALLASPAASFVTGATWDINGGIYMR